MAIMDQYLVLLMLRNIQQSFDAFTIQLYKGPGNSWISNSSSESSWFIFKGLSYYLECKGWKAQSFIDVETVHKRSTIHATSNCPAFELVLTFSARWWCSSERNQPLPVGAYILVGTMASSVSPSLAWKLDEKPDFLNLRSCDHSIIPQFRKTQSLIWLTLQTKQKFSYRYFHVCIFIWAYKFIWKHWKKSHIFYTNVYNYLYSSLCAMTGVRNGNPFQYSCLENPMGRGS